MCFLHLTFFDFPAEPALPLPPPPPPPFPPFPGPGIGKNIPFYREIQSMHILTPWIEFDVIAQPDETCREELKRQHAHLARLQTVPCTAVKDAQFPGKLFAATAFIATLP